LKAQAISGWRQQRLLTCCFVNVFDFGTSNTSAKIGYRNVRFFLLFCTYHSTRKRTFSFLIQGETAFFFAVKFTVPVSLGFTFYKNLGLRE
jgi:hypothetical protein